MQKMEDLKNNSVNKLQRCVPNPCKKDEEERYQISLEWTTTDLKIKIAHLKRKKKAKE